MSAPQHSMIQFAPKMNLDRLAVFLTEHPDWSPCLRGIETKTGYTVVQTVGVFAQSGSLYTLQAVERTMEAKRRG